MSAKKHSRLRRSATTRPASSTAPTPGGDPFVASVTGDASMLLALAAPAARAPSPAVKDALLARIRATKSSAGRAGPEQQPKGPANASQRLALPQTAGWRFEKLAMDVGWVKLPLPGLRMREVTVDAARDTALLFVEMAPGAIFPDHDHSTAERGLVLTGDLQMGERLIGAGDFYEADAGTRHERISSPSGCTGLLWVGAKAWERWRAAAVAS